jgi:hypothetical protein
MIKTVSDSITSEDISWSNCVGICTNGAATALTTQKKGFQAGVRQVVPHINFIPLHHSYSGFSIKRPSAKITYYATIGRNSRKLWESLPLNSRLFTALCKEMQADHKLLLYFSEVNLLSRGKFLKRLVELQEEVFRFL